MKKLIIGPHVSIAKGFLKAAEHAFALGGNTFQYFTRNPRGGAVRAFDEADATAWADFMTAHDFGPVLAHAPYTLNMASSKEETRDFAYRAFTEDLARLELLPCSLYNFHPGSHTGDGEETGIARITGILNRGLTPEITTTVLLEMMAGKGTEIGRSLEQIAQIIEKTELADKIGVCVDTCHVFSAGYNIAEDLSAFLNAFDSVVGLDRLKALHLNDSLTPFGSNKDRHEKLGQGSIGEALFRAIVTEPRLAGRPFLLETPNEDAGYAKEIAMLREAAGQS